MDGLRQSNSVLAACCVLGILVLGASSWLAQDRLTEHARATTAQSLSTVLQTTHQAVASWVRAHQATAMVWAGTPEVESAARALEAAWRAGESLADHPAQLELRRLMQPVLSATSHDGYFIVGPDGVNLASGEDENLGCQCLLTEQPAFLSRIRAGETAVSLPQVSDVPLRDRDGVLRPGLATMFVGVPIRGPEGNVVAVFANRIDPREDFTSILQRGRIGQSGETYAFDRTGRLISSSRFERQLEAIGLVAPGENPILNVELRDPGVNLVEREAPADDRGSRPLTRMAASATAGESGQDLVGYRDYRGVPVVGAWLWDADLGFGLTTEMDAAEAYSTLGDSRLVIALLTLLATALLVGLTLLFGSSRARARYSAAFNRSVLRSLASHIAVLDASGNITAVNDAWERFARENGAGDDAAVGIGVNYLDVCRRATGPFAEEAVAVVAGIESVLGGRSKRFTIEYPCHAPDRERWFVLTATPLTTSGSGAVVSHIDITERKQAEREVQRYQTGLEQRVKARSRELFESEEQLRDLYENAPISHVTVDVEAGTILRHNGAFVQLLGYDAAALSALTFCELYTEVDRPKARRVQAEARAGLPVRDQELRMRHRDGGTVWVSFSMTPWTDASGHATHARCALIDISRRKRAEENLRLTQKVFEETAEAILITDGARRIVDVNEAFCAMSGYGRSELLGREPSTLSSGRHDTAFYEDMWQAITTTGHWQGEIWDRRKDGEAYPCWTSISGVRDEAGTVTHYVGVFSDITTIKETEQRLEQLAHFDQLTGLANRMLFHDRLRLALTRAPRHGDAMAVIYVDLDGFKQVNDSLGHQAGDALLIRAAHALRACVRDEDTVARLGGDEFAIVMGELGPGSIDVEHVVQRIVHALRMSVPFGERELRVSGSVGVAFYPMDGSDADTILRNADQAMYHAKEQGKDRYVFFDPQINARVVGRIHLESDLRAAVEDEQIFLEYQPIIDLRTRQVVSVEALARWAHPVRGVLAPDDFIPFAEETGLILPLGRRVLARVCEDVRRWHEDGRRDVPVVLNLSALQFRENDLMKDIEDAVSSAGIRYDTLEIEVTESLIMDDMRRSVAILERMQQLGIRVSIDDFGTGYSSLGTLHRLPVDALKIDRSFVTRLPEDPHSRAIVSAIISMAHALDKKAIAEGVETREQLHFLAGEGCDECQGFMLGRPVRADRVASEIRRIDGRAAVARVHP